jgi:uncharacterized OB-fold protein
MQVTGEYLGMPVAIDDLDKENREFFKHCANHDFHLQACDDCSMLRYPPTTACPYCASPNSTWKPVEGKGTLYSYGEIHHAIQPVFRQHSPYLLLLVELDTQRGKPGEHDGLRITGNLATADGELADDTLVRSVGIGSRLKMTFKDAGDDIAIPLWCIDEDAEQPDKPWRYAIE